MSRYNRLKLLRVVEEYLASTGTSPSTLGKVALNDPCFVSNLRKGKQPRAATQHRLLDHIINRLEELCSTSCEGWKTIYANGLERAAAQSRASINATIVMPIPATRLGGAGQVGSYS